MLWPLLQSLLIAVHFRDLPTPVLDPGIVRFDLRYGPEGVLCRKQIHCVYGERDKWNKIREGSTTQLFVEMLNGILSSSIG